MSSILKALKKVESNSPAEDPPRGWSAQVDPRKAAPPRAKRIWRLHRAAVLLLAALLLLAGGWLVYRQRHLFFHGSPTASGTEGHAAKTGTFHVKSRSRAPYAASTHGTTGRGSLNPPRKGRTSSRAVRSISPSKDAQPSVSARSGYTRKPASVGPMPKRGLAKNTKALSKSANLSNSSPAAGAAGRPRPAAPGSTSGRKSGLPVMPQIDGAGLKVQAIAWSENASRRLAVINNQVVREGETVDGFAVTEIRPDEVIVRDTSGSWRLEFGLHP